jgi:hypothetical protein
MSEDYKLSSLAPGASTDSVAKASLGGIVVYATTESRLRSGIAALADAVVHCARAHASLDRRFLLSAVARHLGHRVDSRVFIGVLGSQMRLGRLDRVSCEGDAGAVFRVIIAADHLAQFDERCEEVGRWLFHRKQLRIRDVRDKFFGQAPGTWSAASHVVGRLVLVGRAQYVDRYHFAWPTGLERALG